MGLKNVFPIKSMILALAIIYLTLATNYITIPPGVREEFLKHKGLQYAVVFIIAYMATDFQSNNMMYRIIASIIVTLFYYFMTREQLINKIATDF